MRALKTNLRVEIENETRVFLESLFFEIEMKVLQKSGLQNRLGQICFEKKSSNSTVEFRLKREWTLNLGTIRLDWPISELSERGKICPDGAQN